MWTEGSGQREGTVVTLWDPPESCFHISGRPAAPLRAPRRRPCGRGDVLCLCVLLVIKESLGVFLESNWSVDFHFFKKDLFHLKCSSVEGGVL